MSSILKLFGRKNSKEHRNSKEDSIPYCDTEDVENEAPNLEYHNQRRMSVSRSGRYKQKNKIRSGIWDNPGLCTDNEPEKISLDDYYETYDDGTEKDLNYESEEKENGVQKYVETSNVKEICTKDQNCDGETKDISTRKENKQEAHLALVIPYSACSSQEVKEYEGLRPLGHRRGSDSSSALTDHTDQLTKEIENLASEVAEEMDNTIQEETAL